MRKRLPNITAWVIILAMACGVSFAGPRHFRPSAFDPSRPGAIGSTTAAAANFTKATSADIAATNSIITNMDNNRGRITNSFTVADLVAGKQTGAAYWFDATDDQIVATAAAAMNNIFDDGGFVCADIYPMSDGEGSSGRIVQKGTTFSWLLALQEDDGSNAKLSFQKDFNTTDGVWTTTSAVVPLKSWSTVCVTYDNDAVANNPTFYIHGKSYTVGSGITETGIGPEGTRDDDTADPLIIGNADGTRTFDGMIANVRIGNDDLSSSAPDIGILSGGPTPYLYTGASQTALAAGNFTIGKRYRVATYTNGNWGGAGAASNAAGVEFTATAVADGVLDADDTALRIGEVAAYDSKNITPTQWVDSSPNELHGTVSGAIPVGLPTTFATYGSSGGNYITSFIVDPDVSTYGPTIRGSTTRDATSRIYFEGGFIARDDAQLYFGSSSADALMEWDTVGNDYLSIQTEVNGVGYSGNIVISGMATKPTPAYPTVANPTLRIQGNSTTIAHYLQAYHDQTDGYIETGTGDLILKPTGGNVGFGTTDPQGNIQVTTEDPHGGYVIKTYAATSGALTGATDTIELNIPSGWRIEQCQLHVKTAVVDSGGDDTWSSELNDGGQEEVISAGSAAAQNTNVNHWADADTWGTLTDAETDILLTPNGGNFSSGEIEAHCIAKGFDAWTNE